MVETLIVTFVFMFNFYSGLNKSEYNQLKIIYLNKTYHSKNYSVNVLFYLSFLIYCCIFKRNFFDFQFAQELSQPHLGPIWCMKFSQCGQLLATAGQDTKLRIWVLKNSYSYFDEMRNRYILKLKQKFRQIVQLWRKLREIGI